MDTRYTHSKYWIEPGDEVVAIRTRQGFRRGQVFTVALVRWPFFAPDGRVELWTMHDFIRLDSLPADWQEKIRAFNIKLEKHYETQNK